jgi:hypothetical protein
MLRSAFSALLLTSLIVLPAASQRNGATFPLSVAASTIVGEDAAFAEITGGAVGNDGAVYVVDRLQCRVYAFSAAGRLLWTTGRKGDGPGEYRMPYRVAASPDGSVLVYDLAIGEVTRLTMAGRFVERSRFPFRFQVLDKIVAQAGGRLVVAGYSNAGERVRKFGLHRFVARGGQLVHEGSFGPLPPVRDTSLLRYWGAGDAALAPNGDILFSLRLPYHLYRYDALGRQLRSFTPPFRLRGHPEDVLRLERDSRGERISDTGNQIEEPGPVTELAGGWLLSIRRIPHGGLWDLFDRSGSYVGTRRSPAGANGLIGADVTRGILWFAGTRDDAPVLVRVQIGMHGAPPARRSR